jgi:glucose-6-phosphate dehydrogenase assembly protein OpcA
LIEGATVRDIERELASLRNAMADPGGPPALRTSSSTHIAWVPEEWEGAARETLEGLAERHPSRGILLLPAPESRRDELDAEVLVRCFRNESLGRDVCAEVIVIRLNGDRASAPASIVLPLLVSDLPVFLRWRGEPPFGEQPFEELVDVADRLIVDSRECGLPERTMASLAAYLPRVAISDIAWARTEPWRHGLAALWPGIAEASELRVAGPQADALLLAHWLRSRLGRALRLHRDAADELEEVELDGTAVLPDRLAPRSASDLLSAELDSYGRDATYEAALGSIAGALRSRT